MRQRVTARVLLLDRANRILLMRGRLPSGPDAVSAWFTVGGGVEPGETLEEAARREVAEEAGIDDVEIGPVIWRRRAIYRMANDEPVLFLESYLVARCDAVEPSRDGWDEAEQALCDDIRWWTLDDLGATAEDVYPEGLARLLPDIVAGAYPLEPVDITAFMPPDGGALS